MRGQTFLLVSRFTGATKRSVRSVRGNTPNHPITYSRPSTLTRVNSSRVNSHSPLSQLVPCVNSSPSQLVLGSTRPRVNSNPGQLELGSIRPRDNSSPCQLAPGQLVPDSTRPRVTIRPRVNSSSSQLVPGSTRDCTCPWSTCTHVNLHPRQLAP